MDKEELFRLNLAQQLSETGVKGLERIVPTVPPQEGRRRLALRVRATIQAAHARADRRPM